MFSRFNQFMVHIQVAGHLYSWVTGSKYLFVYLKDRITERERDQDLSAGSLSHGQRQESAKPKPESFPDLPAGGRGSCACPLFTSFPSHWQGTDWEVEQLDSYWCSYGMAVSQVVVLLCWPLSYWFLKTERKLSEYLLQYLRFMYVKFEIMTVFQDIYLDSYWVSYFRCYVGTLCMYSRMLLLAISHS